MSNVIIDKSKIDILANAISVKSGEPVTMTLDEMVEAVDGIDTSGGGGTPTLETITKTYTPSTSAVTDTITASAGYDGIEEVDVTVSAVPTGSIAVSISGNFRTINGTEVFRVSADAGVDSNNDMGAEGYISDHTLVSATDDYPIVPSGTSVTPTESAQTIGGNGKMMAGAVTVNAIPSSYVGTGITRRSSSDLTASGATVTVPSGYYTAQASKAVASGTATAPTTISGTSATVSTGTNTLTLSKTVSVTPRITTAGYVSAGTAGNSAVSLTANVTTKAAATITPTTTNQTISSGTYLTGAQTISGDANLIAGNIKSGTTIFGVTGTYSGGGGSSMNVQVAQSTSRATSSTYTSVISLTCSTAGTYDIYWDCFRSSTGGTNGSQLYIGGQAYGTANTVFTNHAQTNHLTNVTLQANQSVAVYARSRGSNYYAYVGTLVIKQTS